LDYVIGKPAGGKIEAGNWLGELVPSIKQLIKGKHSGNLNNGTKK
jgi:hypothetical protein